MKKKQSFEGMLEELNGLLDRLSADETPLDEALKLYAAAAEKLAACNALLSAARVQVTEISEGMQERGEAEDAGE